MSVDTTSPLRLCIGIRDTRERDSRKMSGKNFPVPLNSSPAGANGEKRNSKRLSTLLGIKKVCPANVELYVKNCTSCQGGMDAISMVTSVTFYCEPGTCFVHEEDTSHTDVHNQHYPPFFLKRLVLKPCEFNIKIKLRDQSVHFVKQRFDLLRYSETLHECYLNTTNIPKQMTPSPLPSQKFYIEFDLLVPYPFSLTKGSSPHHIADFIESVSLRPCKFVGYYLDEPRDGLSVSEKLLYELSWKLALVSIPLTADRVALPLVMKLKSPAVKGTSGLSAVASVLTAIESAFDKLKVLRRPGIRIGIDVIHNDFEQMKKLTRQYFKFYDVIEDIVKQYEDIEFQYRFMENPTDKVHLNTDDILIQRIEKSHEFSMVGNYMGNNRLDIATLIDSASCLEELIEFACPVSTRSYRYDMHSIVSKGHLEFRFEMPDIDFHPMSCVIGTLLRFVSSAIVLPSPKRFSRKGKGKGRTLSMRKHNFFKWLVQDRYLEEYFEAILPKQQQQQQAQPEENDNNSNKNNNNNDDHNDNDKEEVVLFQEDSDFRNTKFDYNAHLIHNLDDNLSATSSKGSLASSGGGSAYRPMQSLTPGMSSSSLLGPLLSSMQDKLNDSVLSCAPPPPERKPSTTSTRSIRTSRSRSTSVECYEQC